MISKRYRLRDASLSGLKVYAYSDSSKLADIRVNKEKDTLAKFSFFLKLGLASWINRFYL